MAAGCPDRREGKDRARTLTLSCDVGRHGLALECPLLLTFADVAAFEQWLDEHGETSPGAWLRFAKRGAPEATVSKSDAIDCALAHGWVDGQLGRVDECFFKTRFTPRRPRSIWSQVNRERVERLEQAGRMHPRGRAQVDKAKADGRWAAAYARQSDIAPDADLVAALDAEPAARQLFDALDAANRFALLPHSPGKHGGATSCQDR